MGVTIGVNNRTVVHKGSGGKSIAFPDVCLTPVGSSVVPIPYPNIAVSSDMDNGAKTVKSDGNPMGHEKSIFKKSTGDEAGSKKGVASGTLGDKAEFISFSLDVEIEGKGVVRAADQMIHNNKNTPPTVLLQPPLIQKIKDEPPVIPKQNTIELQILDPFGEPLVGVEFDAELNGVKSKVKTISKGRIIFVTDQEKNTVKIENKELGLTLLKEE